MLVRINHHQPQQVCAGSFGQRQVVLHEPPRAPVLRAKQPHRADRHGQLVPRAVRADPPQDQGRGRDLLHVHGGEAHQLQPLLHGRCAHNGSVVNISLARD